MAEANGSGCLDRIETLLEKLAERQNEFQIIQEHNHERFTREAQQMLTWQVLTQEKMDRERERLTALSEKTDERIASLVGAIGELSKNRQAESK